MSGDERTHGNSLLHTEFEAINNLWKEKLIQEIYMRRAEYNLNDSTK